MKLKIIVLMILMIISINNVFGVDSSYEYNLPVNIHYTLGGSYYAANTYPIYWNIGDVETLKSMDFLQFECDNVAGVETSEYTHVNLYSDSAKTQFIGTGIYGYIKKYGTNTWYIQLFIDDELNWNGLTGNQRIYWTYWNAITTPYLRCDVDGGPGTEDNPANDQIYLRTYFNVYTYTPVGTGTVSYTNYFINNVSYIYNTESDSFDYYLNRSSTYPSYLKIVNEEQTLKNETAIKDTDEYFPYGNTTYKIWDTYVTTQYGNVIYKQIDWSELMDEDDEVDENLPTLTTDKTYYNTSETITINYTNLNYIYDNCYESKCEHPYELYILYPVIDEYKQYEPKFQTYLPYYYDDDGTGLKYDDDSITLNTSILSPQNAYVLGIIGKNGYYGLHNDMLLFSDSFVVYPANEYLNTNCEGRNVYVGTDIIIYYKIENNSNIIIKDNDNNIINTYYNIIDEGKILYTIPGDINHLNTYPNWKIYLNNTEYSTSFNKEINVYWSQFITPTPTATFTPSPTPDINVSDTVDELKTEVEPIKQLLFGLTEIIIDNPDYNKDNIVDEGEINHWFNSLIPICIVLLLIVMYIGLKKKRN